MAKDKIGAHGKRRSEMKELHEQQTSGNEPKMMAANGKDAGSYQIREDESHLLHVELEIPLFDQATGQRKSTPRVQIYSQKEFEAAKANNGFVGYTVKVLHAPTEAKKALGEAVEGAREVDSNYAQMQGKFEALTGRKPEADWTASKLDAAIRFAEEFGINPVPAPEPIKAAEVAPHKEPLVVGTPAFNALAGEGVAIENKEQLYKAAANVAENHAPSNDGTTAVGQETQTRAAATGQPETTEAEVSTGRRGKSPAVAGKAKAAPAAPATSAARE